MGLEYYSFTSVILDKFLLPSLLSNLKKKIYKPYIIFNFLVM